MGVRGRLGKGDGRAGRECDEVCALEKGRADGLASVVLGDLVLSSDGGSESHCCVGVCWMGGSRRMPNQWTVTCHWIAGSHFSSPIKVVVSQPRRRAGNSLS